MKATINRNANTDEGRLTLTLEQDGDRWRWYDEDGMDSEVSGETIADAHKAAHMAWGAGDWDLITELILCPECDQCVSPVDDEIGCGCHCPNCGERL